MTKEKTVSIIPKWSNVYENGIYLSSWHPQMIAVTRQVGNTASCYRRVVSKTECITRPSKEKWKENIINSISFFTYMKCYCAEYIICHMYIMYFEIHIYSGYMITKE
jgi:hypothetical protein